ncbi:MAG: 2OG-Fe(II) oxygenase [Sumerlaeia bacterium]
MIQEQKSERLSRILSDLEREGWCHLPGFLDQAETAVLASQAMASWQDGAFEQAAVGHGAARQLRPEIRSDYIHWVDPAAATGALGDYLNFLEELRLGANQSFFLGLFDYEGHFALYPAGSFYAAHLDNFRNQSRRMLTCLLYLNHDWVPEHGGVLRLYTQWEPEAERAFVDIEPRGGTLVVFAAERFYHEVLPAHSERLSLTGWLCRRD